MNRRRLSVSSWSLNQELGAMRVTGPTERGFQAVPPTALPLLELPRQIAKRSIETLEICHFHLPSTDPGYIAQLREQLETNHVELWSLLIDDGDLNGPNATRDFEWMCGWIDIAAQLGARNARVIAGQGPPNNANFCASVKQLEHLSRFASERGVQLMTENWCATLSSPQMVRRLFDELGEQLDLCLDFGNWQGISKYGGFAEVAPYATSCHARADFGLSGFLDETDFRRCLKIMVDADFHGPFTLIPSGRIDSEWVAINDSARIAREYCE